MSPALPERAWIAVRAGDWWAYKIPPLLVVGFAGALVFESGPAAWTLLALTLAAIVLTAIYGYLLNDLCDIDADRASGRPNRMAAVGPVGRVTGIAVPAVGALLIAVCTDDAVLVLLVAVNLALPTLYSVPPVRLKGRGSWGALADASGVHAVPAAIVARAVTTIGTAEAAWPPLLFALAAVSWAFLVGVRGILVHQVADRESDERAGVMTLGRRLGPDSARRAVLFALFPAELVCLALFLGPALREAPAAAALAASGVGLDLWRRRRGWRLPLFEPPETSRERVIPLLSNEVYELWLPIGLAIQIAAGRPTLAWLPVALVALFWTNVRARLSDLGRLTAPSKVNGSGRGRASAPVILAATSWTVNGVNVFSANMARELAAAGVPAEVLLTEENTDLTTSRERPLPRPAGVTFRDLPTDQLGGWGDHWGSLVRYLEDAAPCVYVPNSDWRHSCVCPQLSDRVAIVGVVHSDDPLHYDHVRRLGPYWNAVVAVSRAVAERALAVCPSIEGRLTTIPIGVRIPAIPPARGPARALRVVYHGILKQHQKRVLDLPRIAQAAVDLGVPIELTIAGAGPEEAALRAAAEPLVERGVITFAGVLSPDDMPGLLEAHDVYLLASEFEGMPNALIEAMGRGCVPVVSRMTSGIPELVQDGENGLLAPVGDHRAFAAALQALWDDPARRAALSAEAFRTISAGTYRVEDMVAAYRQVFDRALDDARAGRFVRPRGPLSHPPREVAGVSLFPVDLPHVEADLGAFPSAEDASDYRRQLSAPRRGRTRPAPKPARGSTSVSLDNVSIVVGAPVWTANGVNHLAEDLVRGLRDQGLDARLLLTEETTRLVQIDEPRMARPTDIPVDELRVDEPENWGARWGTLAGRLEAAPTAIYLPGYDWRHASISPALGAQVVVIGSVHDRDDTYVEQAARLASSWNGVIATGRSGGRRLRDRVPALADRLRLIAHGLAVPAAMPPHAVLADGRVQVLLVAMGEEADPCSAWAAAVAEQLAHRPGCEVLAIDPPEAAADRLARAGIQIRRRLNRQQWTAECRASHFVLAPYLTDDTRRVVVEAMGQGGVPVVAHVTAGGPYAIDPASGVVADAADPAGAVAAVAHLAADGGRLMAMSRASHAVARSGGFHGDRMIAAYVDVFRECLAAVATGRFRRPRGGVTPPPAEVAGTSIFPVPLPFTNEDGRFPSREDAVRYRESRQMAAKQAPARAARA
jgi:glycosyltransferase involved in cell wall biosynthesis/4-hydroxybenzoate polyprenyltransferase